MLVATRPHVYTACTPILPRRASHIDAHCRTAAKNQTGTRKLNKVEDEKENQSSAVLESDEELVGNNPEQRNWKGMAIALVVILMVCGFVVVAVVLLSTDETVTIIPSAEVDDIIDKPWNNALVSDTQWVNDKLTWRDKNGIVWLLSGPNGAQERLIPERTMADYDINGFQASANLRYALLSFEKKPIYSHSFNASYFIYDLKLKARHTQLIHHNTDDVFQFAGFGPNGTQMIYILNGDIYYKSEVTSTHNAQRLTKDGKPGLVSNGLADWLYEEEILKTNIAHWWSPNGRFLAFARFDDTGVAREQVSTYVKGNSPLVYAETDGYPYPKAGYDNPTVTMFVYDLKMKNKVQLIRPLIERERLEMLHAVTWTLDSEALLITWSNRTQSVSVTQQCYPTMQTCVDDILQVKKSSATPGGWIPYMNSPYLLSTDPGVFFYVTQAGYGTKGNFRHVAMINYTDKPPYKKFLTDGHWEVTKLLHYDATRRVVYYVSTERRERERHVYSVSVDSSIRKCLTCEGDDVDPCSATNENDVMVTSQPCRYHDAEFGSSSSWFLLHCLGPMMPYSSIASIITDRSSDPSNDRIEPHRLPATESSFNQTKNFTSWYRCGTIKSNGNKINFKYLLPLDHLVAKRPVIFHVGDLNSQNTDFRFRLGFAEYVTMEDSIISVLVDGRGSGNRGDKLLQEVANQPGVLEVEDIHNVLKYLEDKWKVLASTVGIIGTGYGGYVSLLALSDTQRTFECGVAISPIVDWKLYSSVKAEAMFGLPDVNPVGYERSNLIGSPSFLPNSKQLLAFHGTKDRRIKWQHSLLLDYLAVERDLPVGAVSTIFYPDQDHRLSDKRAAKHMYITARLFLRNCLYDKLNIVLPPPRLRTD
uniref:Inactive dipeptidyl peptidase 10 n=1 Tax=Phallusia mammillata TaxID=59560 RepID=A0A6F9DB66_9ASCI|nr:inactive dipeptidyl peptidase 10 [Phallusia mammillata]